MFEEGDYEFFENDGGEFYFFDGADMEMEFEDF